MGRLTAYLVTHHNQEYFHSADVEVYLFSYGNNDNSTIRRSVEFARNIHFVDLFGIKNDHQAASVIASYSVDILIDITSHTYNGRIELTALKPANVVINYLGYPGTVLNLVMNLCI